MKNNHENRSIRVFISSTFIDMQEERDELVKKIFPQLRKICEERGVAWGEVDLRWGINDEQKAEGKVLPICLSEIQNCRPYFIGLLGERYGWVPERIEPRDLLVREPWLQEHLNKSVTELEIIHGVLNNPTMDGHALFYFRDPAFISTLPPEKQAKYLEVPTPDEISTLGAVEAQKRSDERKVKLRLLKEQIRSRKLPVSDYSHSNHLGEMVRADMIRIIDQMFPKDKEPTQLEKEMAEHEAFARSRTFSYIENPGYFSSIDRHFKYQQQPLVVLGDSGLGKTSLLAKYYLRYPGTNKLIHFIGTTPQSSDWAAMVRRIMAELRQRFDIKGDVPSDDSDLREAFANYLYRASVQGGILIILDALNQLEDVKGTRELTWLPPQLPANIRLLVSTLPGKSLDEIKKRGWPSLAVEPLEIKIRKLLVIQYLEQYRKSLNPDQIDTIASCPRTSNPLFLRALLEELRVYGDHYSLSQKIKYYLSSKTVEGLYRKILIRLEHDYNTEHYQLVQNALSLIWASRKGLSENELKDLLGVGNKPLTDSVWSPLQLALEQSLGHHSGLLNFFHDYLRSAVKDKYLLKEEEQKHYHLWLADYFANNPKVSAIRKIDELPWQLAQSKQWKRLAAFLSDLSTFKMVWDRAKYDVCLYWRMVEENSRYRMETAYGPVCRMSFKDLDCANAVAEMLSELGENWKKVAALYDSLVTRHEKHKKKAKIPDLILRRAVLLMDKTDNDKLLGPLKKAQRMAERMKNRATVAESLELQALIYQTIGNTPAAVKLHRRAEMLFKKVNDKEGIIEAYNNQAVMMHDQGKLQDALKLYQKAEKLSLEMGDISWVQTIMGNIAFVLFDMGETRQALKLFDENTETYKNMGHLEGLRYSIGCQGMVHYYMGNLTRASAALKESLKISEDLDYKEWVAFDSIYLALIESHYKRYGNALKLVKQAYKLFMHINEMDYIGLTLNAMAKIHLQAGRPALAKKWIAESEKKCRKYGFQNDLAMALILKAELNKDNKRKSARYLGQAMVICRKRKYAIGIASCMIAQARYYIRHGMLNRAQTMIKRANNIIDKHQLYILLNDTKQVQALANKIKEEKNARTNQ